MAGLQIEDLFMYYADEVYNFLVYFTGNRIIAQDLTQETFVKAMQSLARFRGGNPKAWLLRIARNSALDAMRKGRRFVAVDDDLFLDQRDPAPSVDETVALRDANRRLVTLLGELKPDFRAVILCRTVLDMDVRETALTLGWTPNRVRVTLHRAIRAVRKSVAERGEFHDFTKKWV